MSQSTRQSISKILCWWQYKPADERERQLFLEAYRRFFWSLIGSAFISVIVLELFLTQTVSLPSFTAYQLLHSAEFWLFVVLIVSDLVAATAFRGHEL